ncbi:MAG: hypothetical protein AAB573_00715 [Patescibacteria group bacterium]
MYWAVRRQLAFFFSAVLLIGLIGLGVWYFFIYAPPSCFDGVQNNDEAGIDCDGSCALLCRAPRVDAVWSRVLRVAPGVYHGVAKIKNPESLAKVDGLSYSFSFFDAKNILVAVRKGQLQLNPGETRTIFEQSVVAPERVPVRAFVEVTGGVWNKAETPARRVRIVRQEPYANLRLDAEIENLTADPVLETTVFALLYNDRDIVIGVSKTTIDVLAPREQRPITFTWIEPFADEVERADVEVVETP